VSKKQSLVSASLAQLEEHDNKFIVLVKHPGSIYVESLEFNALEEAQAKLQELRKKGYLQRVE
jgi:hypothetical protein